MDGYQLLFSYTTCEKELKGPSRIGLMANWQTYLSKGCLTIENEFETLIKTLKHIFKSLHG